MKCPCESNLSFDVCCSPYLKGDTFPDTAEKLMRSRYAAFTQQKFEYVKNTLAPEARKGFDMEQLKLSVEKVEWKGLKVLSTKKGGPGDHTGVVEFTAFYEFESETIEHHEISQFRKDEKGHWLFVDGETQTLKNGEIQPQMPEKPQTVVREMPKVGRNDPCSCGSGKKFKKCCAA